MDFFEEEPKKEELEEVEENAHTHECGGCGTPYPCPFLKEECEEPFLCAECQLEGNDD